MDEQSKIIVDDDWKKQAQAEKERLTEEIDHSAEAPADLPEPSFTMIVNLLATQAVASLGGMGGRPGEPIPVDPASAKLFIDLLAVLEEKTKGNLTAQEAAGLKRIIGDLRMSFVQIIEALSRQAAKGPAGPAPAGGAAPASPAPGAAPKIILD